MKKLCLRSGVLAAVAGRRAPNVDFGDSVSCVGGVPYQNPAAWQDDNGHGTHTAGTIAAAKNGPGGDSILQLTAAAPNGRVLSTWPAGFPCTRKVVDVSGATYCYLQGTSMASPHAAGVAALIESRGITSPGAVAARLEATRAQSALRYKEVEPWAWARLSQRLRAVRAKRAKLRPAAEAA